MVSPSWRSPDPSMEWRGGLWVATVVQGGGAMEEKGNGVEGSRSRWPSNSVSETRTTHRRD
ncbi:hypothetical protein SESBI_08973 [Sesbania bispinosa]|nr:hypothetical protein SESBI_08973 [Sesbania bispinosa]